MFRGKRSSFSSSSASDCSFANFFTSLHLYDTNDVISKVRYPIIHRKLYNSLTLFQMGNLNAKVDGHPNPPGQGVWFRLRLRKEGEDESE
jgi:hypothetical protein